jgi:ATP-binding cassette subfamily B protein/subfamily B ATP-binding cassette protein MsbA
VKTFRFIVAYAKPYWKQLLTAVLAMLVLVSVQLLAPQIVRRLVLLVQGGSWDQAARVAITQLGLGLLAAYGIRTVAQFASNYMAHVAGWRVVADVRKQMYHHLQKLSLSFYEDKQTGELMSRTVNDSNLFEQLISHAIPDTLVNAFMLIGVVAVMWWMNPNLMLLTMIPVPLILLAMRGFGKYVRPAFRARQQDLADLNATLNDNLSGIREIKSFTREDIEHVRVSQRINRYRDSMLRALKLMAVFGPLVEFSSSLGTIVVIYFGGRLAFQQVLPIADLVAYFLYLELFYQPVRALSRVWEGIQEAMAGVERVAELLDQQPEVADSADAVDLPDPVQGEVRFEDVSFSYDEGDAVLEEIDLTIPPNSVAALVGPTGVGKTTLAALIPRFYDVCSGTLRIDGHDVRDVTAKSLRQQIAMVLQDVFLFHGTVRENILFGRPDARDEEMIAAAKVANAHDFIMELPNGYDTLVGERGVKLSGGQKQRVSIARAVLKNAPILVLDEATSSVDTETELLIQQALDRLMEGRTTLVIAHRLSTVRHADQIIVLDEHRVSERGTHDELMAASGLYRRLWEVQSRIVPAATLFGDGRERVSAVGEG